jgi:hypothetical protein
MRRRPWISKTTYKSAALSQTLTGCEIRFHERVWKKASGEAGERRIDRRTRQFCPAHSRLVSGRHPSVWIGKKITYEKRFQKRMTTSCHETGKGWTQQTRERANSREVM